MFIFTLLENLYPFLFTITLFSLLLLELTIAFIIISIYFSLPWSQRFVQGIYTTLFNDDQQEWSNDRDEHAQVINEQWINSYRKSMLLRIQNLFSQSSNKDSSSELPSFFEYRCPVCLNRNHSSSYNWIALGCGHLLCLSCTRHLYFGPKPICPHCRCPILLSDLTLLYI